VSVNSSVHRFIKNFNPVVKNLNYISEDLLRQFDAGCSNFPFNEFISDDAKNCAKSGEGVTYVVLNKINEKEEVVSYYTLLSTALPYESKIELEPDEVINDEKYDIKICGIPAIEVKMFAVAEKYQDVFYEYDNESKPISAWILNSMIESAKIMMTSIVGFKVLFLHSVPSAVEFYKNNGFRPVKEGMKPLYCIDDDLDPMYLALKEICMC
jgi:hypothetical protein